MQRQTRLDAPGVLHHVIIRGIERRHIFTNDKDLEDFLNRLTGILPATQTGCYAWALISHSNEKYARRNELKRRGVDLDWIAQRVADIYGLEPHAVLSKGRQQQKVKAGSLFCFWAVRESGVSLRDLARRLEMSGPGVGLSVERGEVIAQERGFVLIE